LAWLLLKDIDVKIAIPHWQGRVSPVFDVAESLFLIDIEDGREVRRENVMLASRDPFGRAKEISALGTAVLLCGALSHPFQTALMGAGIQVVGFVCGDLEAVVNAFLQGQLADVRFHMPGCSEKKQRTGCRRGRRRR
jgi:predicted Fe-Mo cluster-binding NifX family protein